MKKLSFILLACTASALAYGGHPSLRDIQYRGSSHKSEKTSQNTEKTSRDPDGNSQDLQESIISSFLAEPLQTCPELQIVYREDFLDALDHDLFDLAVHQALASSKSELNSTDIKANFRLAVASPEEEHRLLSVYSSLFNEEELKEACALFQDERYIKLRNKLSLAHYICLQEAERILENMVSIPEPEEPEIIQRSFVNVYQSNFDELINSSVPVVIDVYTDWCGPCKHLGLVMKELHHEYGGVYQFAKLDADKEKNLARSLKVNSYPTILFFKNGKEVGRQKGFKDKEALLSQMKRIFQN